MVGGRLSCRLAWGVKVTTSGLIEWLGDGLALALLGLVVGLVFGAAAQRSQFCLRAATVEVSRGTLGPKLAIWLLAFGAAVVATQGLVAAGLLDVRSARQLAGRGSLSGAVLGGLLFGAGMVLARGCASRLLVLSATGNLRALITGLIVTLVAQASFRGILAPLREWMAGLWTIEGGAFRSLLGPVDGNAVFGLAIGLAWLAPGIWLAVCHRIRRDRAMSALVVGLAVAGGWASTYALTQLAFEPVAVKSISFTGPSADTLMALINQPSLPLGFDVGLIPGVFAGSLLAAAVGGDLALQGYEGGASMLRYIAGAVMMGFGSMLAGGCAVGAGVSGGAILATTAWIALLAMWIGAGVTDRLIDREPVEGVSMPPGVSPVPRR
ncbi:MAG: YeeE/YedE family protein [Hyphomicrobiaceae bacterium]|nr:YeeE/YedE family protein [Hyphomicrobiaceae bacterium]